MSVSIHPTAIIEDGAELGEGVTISAYAYIGAHTRLGDGVTIHPQAIVQGRTTLGEGVEVHPGAVVGGGPQVLGFKPNEESRLEVGPRTIIREHATLHTGLPEHGGLTKVGSDCLLMAQVHIAHDCVLGDKCVIANSTHMGGHVTAGDNVWMGGAVAVHQWCRIGDHAFIGGGSILVADVIPYGSVVGNHAHLAGLNVVGLKRRGFSRQTIKDMRAGYRLLYAKEGTFTERLDDTARAFEHVPEVMEIVHFIRENKNRSLCLPR
ncbi:MAG: acyl-ACP--UDP-N-acetylglucosamine O-acyltransferase [Henriciella sp.]|nr:acyl-ACP--UDP-N-acetylglucosamine O-acyltransferase [Henriciella sp.]